MIKQVAFIASLLFSVGAIAGSQNTIPTCHSEKLPASNEALSNELFIIIDQTTQFDNGLKQSIANNIRPFIKAGNSISVIQFSAFIQGHYTDVLASVKLDQPLPAAMRSSISKPLLSKFDQCLANQPRLAGKIIGAALKSALANGNNGIAKSDVLASLKDISTKVSKSNAKRKVVLLASDMLENSSISSFYSKQSVRQINSEQELQLVKKNNLFGNFGNAEVYVIGAGLLVEDSTITKKAYRSPQIMTALLNFWSSWFQQSNATLIDFGQPALLNNIE